MADEMHRMTLIASYTTSPEEATCLLFQIISDGSIPLAYCLMYIEENRDGIGRIASGWYAVGMVAVKECGLGDGCCQAVCKS